MADPPVEGGQPPAITLSICFNKRADADEVFGTVEGTNFRRVLQAQQDDNLKIFHRPPPENPNPRRPQTLYDVLPSSQRKLLTQATYIWDQNKENRLQVWIVVTDSYKHFFQSGTKRTGKSPPLSDHRALFKIGSPDIDIRTLQFLQNAICTICERLPSHTPVSSETTQPAPFLLGKLDDRLKDFILRVARRHAGIPLKPTQIRLSPSGLPAIETTVPVMYRSATDQTTKVCMQVIKLELGRIPPHEDMQNHAFGLLAWISAHTMDRVFVLGSLEIYVDYLKGLACLGSRLDREVSGHGGLYGGMDLFIIGVADAGYTISPSAAAVSHITSGHLPKLCVTDGRDALLRVIEQLETVYLTTGKIESAWKECARRCDFETECVREDEPLPPQRCTCTFAERPNTVHLCNRCNRSLLCGDNASGRGPHVEIICASCADQEQQERPKCHRCYIYTFKCDYTDGSDQCDRCIKNGTSCGPIQLTESGDLPETNKQRELARRARGETSKGARQQQDQQQQEDQKEARRQKQREYRLQKQQEYRQQGKSSKCHRCYMYGKKCHYTDDSEQCDLCTKSKTSCGPVQLTDNGELPKTYYKQKHAQTQEGTAEQHPRCHWCFMRSLICHYLDDSEQCDKCVKDKKPCIPIKLTDTGDLPKTYNQQRSASGETRQRPAPGAPRKWQSRPPPPKNRLERNWQMNMKLDVDTAFEGQDTGSRGLLGSEHWPEYWQQIEQQWSSGKGWPDVFQRVDRAFDQLGRPLLSDQVDDVVEPDASGNAGRRMYGPFGMELDALEPVHQFHGSIVNHAPENIVPTSSFINSLRHVYAPLLLPMVALLCRRPDHEEMERVSQKVDHIFLIALQFEREKAKRIKLLPDVQRTSAINRQHTNGIAEPEACLLIDQPWSVVGRNALADRYHITKRRSSTAVVDVARVEAFITEIETHFDQKLPRADGDAGAVYLFHPTNKPVQWDWYSVRAFYSVRLAIMTRWCNRHYDTHCTVESLFALHCIQYMQAQRGITMPWLLLLLQPYARHPFQASAGHIAHGIEMSTGFFEENISLAAFSEEDCNITFEPFVWNFMKNLYDDLVPRMIQKLQAMPLHNPPYWTEELVLAHAPDLPATKWGGSGKGKSKTGKSKKPKSKTDKSKKSKSTSGEPRTSGKKPKKSKKSKKSKTTQLGDDISRVLRPRKSSTKQKSSTEQESFTSPDGRPDRGNLANWNNICYASAVVQVISNVPALRSLLSDIDSLPFEVETGRGLPAFVRLNDPGFVKYRKFLQHLSNICAILEASNSSVGSQVTLELMDAMREIDPQFTKDKEYDASVLFNEIVTALNAAGDRSERLPDIVKLRPTVKLADAQEERIKNGLLLRPPHEELTDHRAAHRAIGNDSDADQTTNIECVEESECTVDSCVSPHARSFQNLRTMRLSFPVDSPDYTNDRAYGVHELIQHWAVKEGRSTCDFNAAHGLRREAVKKIVGTPEVLVVHMDRLARVQEERKPGQNLEDQRGFAKNPLLIEHVIDLREQCERKLPSEEVFETGLPLPSTRYRLRAVLRYTYSHFLTYARTSDNAGTLHWAKFDDRRGRVEWEDPTQSTTDQAGDIFDFMLFYERMTADDEAIATAKGSGATAPGYTATEAIDISSAEEVSDEEDSDMDISGEEKEASEYAASSEKEDSDDAEDSDADEDSDLDEDHDAEEEFYEELHEDFGYEVEYEGLPYALTAESASESESSDDGSDISSEDEDFDGNLPQPDFEDLTPEAQAREIAIVFQQAAEPEALPDYVKNALRANAKQVLIVGSMLAKALRKQAQGDDYESSGDSTASDDEMPYQPSDDDSAAGSKYWLRRFKKLPAYQKGSTIAVGADYASDLLEAEEHHLDLLRKLHLYSGRAIMMCKKLHNVDNAPDHHNSELFEMIPTLRSRGIGLRLAALYRSIATASEKLPEGPNYSDLCNLDICSSYVVELGWKLDDLEVAQEEHNSKVAELEDRNKSLEARVAELQAQLQDLKVAKPGDPKAAQSAVKPDVSTLSAADLFEHLQSVVQESRKFMLPEPSVSRSDEMEVDEPVTSGISGSEQEAPPKKQGFSMSGDLPIHTATSGMPTNEQQGPEEKQDISMSEDRPIHPESTGMSGSEQEVPPEKQDVTISGDLPIHPTTSGPSASEQQAPSEKQDIITSGDLPIHPEPTGITTSEQEAPKEKQDADMSGLSPVEGGDAQPELDTGKFKLGQKTTVSGNEPGPPPKPSGSPTKGSRKPPKGGIPNFMSTTAAAAARSRPPVSKTDTKSDTGPPPRAPTRGETRAGHRPKTRAATHAATRAGVSAEEETPARPVTPTRQPATSLAAPETREEVHTGGRRRQGHVGVSPPSPSDTPSKKLRPHVSDEEDASA